MQLTYLVGAAAVAVGVSAQTSIRYVYTRLHNHRAKYRRVWN